MLLVKVPARVPDAAPKDGGLLKVNGTSKASAVAGAIAGKVREGTDVLSATGVGPAAVLKMVKAVALARLYLKADGKDLYAAPRFTEVTIDGEKRTGVSIDIFAHRA